MAWLPASRMDKNTRAYRHARQQCPYGSFMKGDVMKKAWFGNFKLHCLWSET